MTNDYRIAVIAGDGSGQEVMPEGLKVLRAAEQTLGNFVKRLILCSER